MSKPPLPKNKNPKKSVVNSPLSLMGGIPMRLQLFGLIIGFIAVVSAVSFKTSYNFILNDKESSLRELQLLRVEQVRSKVETRIETIKGMVIESTLRLLDASRTQPELNAEEWQYLVAEGKRWTAPNLQLDQVPQKAFASTPLQVELSPDKEWVLWSQQIDVAVGSKTRSVPVQAKFRSSLIFKSVAEFQEGGLGIVMVRRNGPATYELIWGNESGIEKLLLIDGVEPTLLDQATELSSRELVIDDQSLYAAWGSAKGTSWLVASTVEESTLVAGLNFLVANQGFWVIIIILIAVIVSVWFARRFSKPIETLVGASRQLEVGDFSVRVSPDGPTELRSLGAAFNHMGQALEDREAALRSAQDALIQNEKLAALGTLSAGIAHEVKNPLAGILGNADLLASSLETGKITPKATQYVDTIRKETRRCREIIDSLMRFSRQEATATEKVEVDLELVAWDVINLVEHSLNMQGLHVQKEFQDDMPVVVGVSNQIQQVLLNMMQNAGHAMENSGGKNITIGVESFRSIDEAYVGGFVALDSGSIRGKVARVWIRDEGVGMSPEIQRRIFEPFFTTKEAGKGTGLGLAVTMGILADHEVRLSIDSAEGQGTTFYIDFSAVGPRSEEIQQKVQEMRAKASGGEQGAFDVVSHAVASVAEPEPDLNAVSDELNESSLFESSLPQGDRPLMGDDKPINLFNESDSPPEVEADESSKTVTNFAIRKPKLKE
jgi:signal transduction histidine kinase